MDRLQAHSTLGPVGNHWVEGLEEELGDSLAGCALYPDDLEQSGILEFSQLRFARVAFRKDHPMVQVLVYPVLDKVKISEIDHEPIAVQFACLESQGDGPAMPVQAGATALVKGLAVGKGDVPIGLATGDHALVSGFIFRGVGYLGELECFLAFHAGSAFSAMVVPSFTFSRECIFGGYAR